MSQALVKIEKKDHYYFDSKSKKIYFIRKVSGKVIKFSTGIDFDGSPGCLIKASRVVSVKENENKEKDKKKKFQSRKLMGEYIDELIDRNSSFHLSKNTPVSDETMESYVTSRGHLRPFFESYAPDETDDAAWKKFTDYFQAKYPSYTLFNVTKHFRALTRHLHSKGLIKVRPNVFNPNAKKEDISRKKKRHRVYSPDEIMAMDSVCGEDQRLALWLGYDLGFRSDDCVKLSWNRVHFDKNNPFIEFHGDENKTGFTGRVPISDTCMELLKERKKGSVSRWVFPLKSDPDCHILSQALTFEEVVRDSGVNYGSHHLLRHTRLTEDFGNPSLDNAMVMKIRRVSLAIALKHYIHPTDGDLEMFRNTGKASRKSK